jgi:LmbE family N-acetylglucosaminyl deacetylase
VTAAGPVSPTYSSRFLDQLADPQRPPIDADRVLVLVAHPDDETIALGAQIARLHGLLVLHTTDGAPSDMRDAEANGLPSREAYALARRRELEAAMALGGLHPDQLLLIGVEDQTTARQLPLLAREIAAVLSEYRIKTILTHAFEGGHPDHDATAYAARAARRLAAQEDGPAPELIEFPLYHMRGGRFIWQEFVPDSDAGPEVTLHLTDADFAAKRRMLDAHVTQRRVLAKCDSRVERFRVAAPVDFSLPANGGELNYERHPWRLTGEQWLACARNASDELGIPLCL